jgi:hypothetical protein
LAPKEYNDCIKSENKQISGIKKDLGEMAIPALSAFLNVVVVDLVLFFNVGNQMSADQVKETVKMLIEDYWMLKPEDFKLCFSSAKKGLYGTVYNRIDGMIIMDWLNKYIDGRTAFASSGILDNHSKFITENINHRMDQQSEKEKEEGIRLQVAGMNIQREQSHGQGEI